ncbi:SpoIIE family protein phosphatase [Streptomyces fradiae]|uniref:SpoIIE family protein phosphatase n=1 Tax=Streptomyces fradiae TaxID=1906 RepID=UPI0036593452
MRDSTPLGGDAGGLPDPEAPAAAVVDARCVVTGWSEGAERLLGYPPQAVIGRPAARLLGETPDARSAPGPGPAPDARWTPEPGPFAQPADPDPRRGPGTGSVLDPRPERGERPHPAGPGRGPDRGAADPDGGRGGEGKAEGAAGRAACAALDGRSVPVLLRHRDGRHVAARLRAYPWIDGEGRAQRLVVATPQERPAPNRPGERTGQDRSAGSAASARPDDRPDARTGHRSDGRPSTDRAPGEAGPPPGPQGTAPQPTAPQPTAPPPVEPGPGPDPAAGEAMFDQCRLPVMVFDSALRAVRATAGAQHELGLSEERMAGRSVTEILPPHICHEVEDGMCRVLGTGETERFPVRGRARPGAPERVWSITVSPLRDPAGRVRHLEVSALDITEQHLARERLALLNDVSAQIGSTLDVMRTAQETADVAVGRLADFVTIDLRDSLFRGVEPRPSRTGAVTLRRAAQQSVLPGVPEALVAPGDLDDYPESSPPARCLATGRPSLHRTLDGAVRAWQEADPRRSGVVRAFGIHSLMVIPLRARGIILGVAVFVRHRREDPFTEDDLSLAEEIGARAAVAVDNARRYTLERETALALQRSLLPHRLAAQDAVEVAHRYLPARTRAGLGGDWFDVIPLSGARVALVVGDVVGHGLRASATMGRLRTAVRTLADVDLPPDELLTHLDDLITHVSAEEETSAPRRSAGLEVPTDLIATCLYVVYDPVSGRCTAATAGHPPPAVVTPAGGVDFAAIPPGPPLGLGGLPFETLDWEVPAGGLLVLYTDGLVQGEEHDPGGGLDRLLRALERPARSLEATCDHLVRTLLPSHPGDDVVLLAARARALGPDRVATWDLPSEPAAVARARSGVLDRLAEWHLDDVAFTAELLVSELVTNAIRYGRPPVQLRLIHGTSLIVEVYDGSSTAPHLRRARAFDEGGRGLLLVAQFAQRWGTRHRAEGKTIWAEIELPVRQRQP